MTLRVHIMILELLILLVLSGKIFGLENRAGTVADQIRFLVDEEKTLREALLARVQRLKSETSSLAASITPCQCSSPTNNTSGREVAYTGTISKSALTSLTASTVFNFSSDFVNVGHAFNINTGHFVVPTSGLYGFSLTIHMVSSSSYWTAMRLVKNGNQLLGAKTGHYYSSSYDRQVNMATNYIIGNFSSGEEIWPQYVSGSGARLYGNGVSTFTGVLLHEF